MTLFKGMTIGQGLFKCWFHIVPICVASNVNEKFLLGIPALQQMMHAAQF